MIEDVIADRYATALSAVASDRDVVSRVRDDVERFARLLLPDRGDDAVPELLSVLRSPGVSPARKERITGLICEQLEPSPEASAFLRLLIRKGRIALIGRIADEFRQRAARSRGVVTADVESARVLSEADLARLRDVIEHAVGLQVEIAVRVRPELLAGVRVRTEGRLIDGSLDGALRKFEATLTQ